MKLTESERKERYRIFWMVKGHFNCTEETVINSYDSYFKRLLVQFDLTKASAKSVNVP